MGDNNPTEKKKTVVIVQSRSKSRNMKGYKKKTRSHEEKLHQRSRSENEAQHEE